MRYDRASRHTSSVSCLGTFHSIFAVTLPLVRSKSWDAQLAVPNDSTYVRLEKCLMIGRPGSIPLQFSFLARGTTPNVGVDGLASRATHNGRRDPKCPSARRLHMVREDTGDPSKGATCAGMATDEAVGL
ncbi:hypothetical protein TNCV_988311 [Trichonephila clavipes]|nr:hypothetical protein TNCV_988311 [Trichonephila clavipes]